MLEKGENLEKEEKKKGFPSWVGWLGLGLAIIIIIILNLIAGP